jgi:hypothetical protein
MIYLNYNNYYIIQLKDIFQNIVFFCINFFKIDREICVTIIQYANLMEITYLIYLFAPF